MEAASYRADKGRTVADGDGDVHLNHHVSPSRPLSCPFFSSRDSRRFVRQNRVQSMFGTESQIDRMSRIVGDQECLFFVSYFFLFFIFFIFILLISPCFWIKGGMLGVRGGSLLRRNVRPGYDFVHLELYRCVSLFIPFFHFIRVHFFRPWFENAGIVRNGRNVRNVRIVRIPELSWPFPPGFDLPLDSQWRRPGRHSTSPRSGLIFAFCLSRL